MIQYKIMQDLYIGQWWLIDITNHKEKAFLTRRQAVACLRKLHPQAKFQPPKSWVGDQTLKFEFHQDAQSSWFSFTK